MEGRADPEYLKSVAYADGRLLADRASLYEFQQPRINLAAAVLHALGDAASGRVLDVGCGYGTYLAALVSQGGAVVGADLSIGMLRGVTSQPAGLVVADAQRLPIAGASVDAVLMMHMLYHVPEPALGVREARRVLRRGGRLVAAVGGPRHLAQARDLWIPLLEEEGIDGDLRDLGFLNTRLPPATLGEMLTDAFDKVDLTILASEVVLTDPGPLLRHASSTTAAKVTAERGADMIARLSAAVSAVIADTGDFRITTEVALFTAGRA